MTEMCRRIPNAWRGAGAQRGTLSTTRTETNIRLRRRGWQNRNLRIYDNYKISLFSVSARAVRATPTQTKLMPAASTCLPTTSVQSSRATRPQMHPALRPRHLARLKAPHEPLFRRAIVQNEAREIARHTVDELDPPRLPIRTQDCATS